MLYLADWRLKKFSKLPNFKYTQSVEFRGSDITEELTDRGPQGLREISL
jgi:hypothetical protein